MIMTKSSRQISNFIKKIRENLQDSFPIGPAIGVFIAFILLRFFERDYLDAGPLRFFGLFVFFFPFSFFSFVGIGSYGPRWLSRLLQWFMWMSAVAGGVIAGWIGLIRSHETFGHLVGWAGIALSVVCAVSMTDDKAKYLHEIQWKRAMGVFQWRKGKN